MNNSFIDIYNDKYRSLSIMTFHDKLIQYNKKIVEGGLQKEILEIMVEIINKYFKLNKNCPFITNSILYDMRSYIIDHKQSNYINIHSFTTKKNTDQLIYDLKYYKPLDDLIIHPKDESYIILQNIIDIGEKNFNILELLNNSFKTDLKDKEINQYIPYIYLNDEQDKKTDDSKNIKLLYNIIKQL